jgi:electron-transferring-flavoprotein dehydrogenase
MPNNRESIQFDVVIVGAGPAGLATAIRLAQIGKQQNKEYSICIVEKGDAVGVHILSGAVMDPIAINELLPNWQELGAPIQTKASKDKFLFLTKKHAITLPVPTSLQNNGNYIISLGNLCIWLAAQAEQLGVQIFPGFAAKEVLYDANGRVIGIATNAVGLDKTEKPKANYQPGIELHATYTVLAEGCRGSLSKEIIHKFSLDKESCPQTYGIGIKELWEIPDSAHKAGEIIHTLGWPLDSKTYGGSFIYYMEPNLVSIGFVIGLDYRNPYLNPFQEFQRFKHHPSIASILQNGKRISYGARAINEGGFQSIPNLTFPGGVLVGCAAGLLNVARIKGSHTAIKSGMLAADAINTALNAAQPPDCLEHYTKNLKASWIYTELNKSRNVRPGFRAGVYLGLAYAAIDNYIFRGRAPWTFKTKTPDNLHLLNKNKAIPISYPKPDNKLSFDRLSSVKLSGTFHAEDQPCHLRLNDTTIPIRINLAQYAEPAQRYCPAGVYEIIIPEGKNVLPPYLQINAQNCIHCKVCDIKDPTQNITWTTPEGGGGPKYSGM